ncbi:MAG: VWA domain-containing protein [Planctomycetes bacterium]|nr:VWA domain-containing protein [Planctomycetota bacterium]
MIPLLNVLVQETAKEGDLWSKLLGIDRVSIGDADWSVTWQHMVPAWVLFLLIIPGVLFVVAMIYRRERQDVGMGSKIVLTIIRSALLVLTLLLLMGPVLTVETIKKRKAFIIVMLDESRSMQKVDLLQSDKEREAVSKVTLVTSETELRLLTRADVVRKVLENPKLKILDELENKLNVAYFTFSSTATARENRVKLLEEYKKETCIGTETAIGDAIKTALNSLRGQYVAGVVVFSDGKNNSGMATKEIASQLKQRYLPIYTVAAGVPHTPKDIALLELEAQEAVLANDVFKTEFKVSSFGYEGESVSANLYAFPLPKDKDKEKEPGQDPKELDKLIEESKKEADLLIPLNNEKKKYALSFQPKVPGEYLLIIRIDPRPEENTAHNNYLTHRLRVADDKIKVLYVEHPPRFEYRYLKNSLVRDPKILTHCILTSADPEFSQEHTRSDDPIFREPLKEFPKDLKALLEYDVVIFGDIDPSKLGPDAAKHLETFVSEFGGGIIFISGAMNNPRTLANTPLANLLPVVADENRDLYEHEKVFSQTFGYQLTPDGRTHPITNFKEFKGDLDKNQEHWEARANPKFGLPGIRWFVRIKKLKAGASPLVELTGVPGESARPPLFVTQHVGRGRVFWSATDETWLWRYVAGDYPWFYPFWQQAMYWTRQGKLLGARRYRVSVDKERYSRGEKVTVYANAFDDKFAPKTDPTIEVFVDPPAGRAGLERIKVLLNKDKTLDGVYEGQWHPDDTGLYRIWAGEEDESTRATAKFTVFIPDREDDDPILDVGTLKELANESAGGKFFPVDEVGRLNEEIQKNDVMLRETKEDDLWDSPLVFLVFAALITTEWILRKILRML